MTGKIDISALTKALLHVRDRYLEQAKEMRELSEKLTKLGRRQIFNADEYDTLSDASIAVLELAVIREMKAEEFTEKYDRCKEPIELECPNRQLALVG